MHISLAPFSLSVLSFLTSFSQVNITDAGPAMWVEQKAGRAIIDAGVAVCQQLFGKNSCGCTMPFLFPSSSFLSFSPLLSS